MQLEVLDQAPVPVSAQIRYCGNILAGKRAFDGVRAHFFENAFLPEPAVDRGADVFIIHAGPSLHPRKVKDVMLNQ